MGRSTTAVMLLGLATSGVASTGMAQAETVAPPVASEQVAPGVPSPPVEPRAPAPSVPGSTEPALTTTVDASRAPSVPARFGADGPTRTARGTSWDAWGEGRARVNQSTAFGVDDVGTSANQRTWAQSRVLAGGRWAPSDTLRFELELDALSGFLVGDAMRLGTTFTPRPFPLALDGNDRVRIIPRKANVLWTTSVGQLSLGAQTFNWGTGMLANDGAGAAQNDGLQFGDAWMGSVVARAAFLTKPFAGSKTDFVRALSLFVAADFVLRDDNASVFDGDLAGAGVIGARVETGPTALGALVVGRHQVDRLDPNRPGATRSLTTVAVFDTWGRHRLDLGRAQHLTLEAEATLIAGRSTRPLSDETLAGADVLQLGGLVRARWDVDPAHLTAALEAGYASGDNDPRDRVARTFSMNSDHNVGFVLFDHVLPMMTARAIDRLAAPALSGTPPASARFLVNPGAVSNAAYLHPVVKWRPLEPVELRLGYAFAVAASDVADAWQTAINGGFSTTPGGRVFGGRVYGHELDARVSWTPTLPGAVRLLLGAEGGLLVPGSAFDGVQNLGTPWLVRGMASVRW
ncbi:MAG: hypothetical protein Q8S33_08690 [Myxococcales bacterium]|nr:hypothetical protein [Myxococcales bacterium]